MDKITRTSYLRKLRCSPSGRRSSGFRTRREATLKRRIPNTAWETSPKSWEDDGPMRIPKPKVDSRLWPARTKLDMKRYITINTV